MDRVEKMYGDMLEKYNLLLFSKVYRTFTVQHKLYDERQR